MQNDALIPVNSFCTHHRIDFAFIDILERFGMLELVNHEGTAYIKEERITELEQYVRLHRELDINPEGIDAIAHLLNRVRKMQEEIIALRNRLALYES